ncbi:glutamate racemase [Candidatus Peregrinibacteria bacterium]|jgi:glutamate racemase|nr:glutamate racemase [Candidatus Peregrinibacteria bacterium]
MIALFDSGIGGLTVLKPVLKELPQYDYIYLGDSARSPYGPRSPETIKKFSEEAVEYLFNRGVTLIIFACNTASSVALRHVQQKYLKGDKEQDRKILGVLIPLAEEVTKQTKTNRVGVVGTKATISSQSYNSEIHKINPETKVYSQTCPLLVPIIEESWHTKPEATSILRKYLKPLKSTNIDTLILGCTHYPIMHKDFQKYMGKKTKVFDTGEVVAKSLADYLERHPEIEKKLSKSTPKKRIFLTTDDPAKMKTFAEKHLGQKIKMPEKITL